MSQAVLIFDHVVENLERCGNDPLQIDVFLKILEAR